MNAGPIERMLLAVIALSGCERIATDPPPPPSRYEIAVAPPGARGARAAGTDAAPKPPGMGVLERPPGSDEEEEGEAPESPEATPDAGAPAPGRGVPL